MTETLAEDDTTKATRENFQESTDGRASCVLVRLGLCKFGLQPWLTCDPLMQLHNVMLKLHLTGSLCLPVLEPLKEKQCYFGA